MATTDNPTVPLVAENQGLPGITEPLDIRIGVTGHKSFAFSPSAEVERRIFEDQLRDQLARRIHSVMAYIDALLVHTPRRYVVISPLAEGADIILADSILAFKPSARLTSVEPSILKVVLPMPEKDYLAEFTDEKQVAAYRRLSSLAVTHVQTPLVEKVTLKADRSRAHQMVGTLVANECDILIAAWDGKPTDKPAGTAATVFKARELGKPVIHLFSPRLQVSRSRNLRLRVTNIIETLFLSWICKSPGAPIFFRLCGIRFLDNEDSILASLKHLDGFNEDLQRKLPSKQGIGLSLREPELVAVEVRSTYRSLYGALCESVTDRGAMEYFETKFGHDLNQVFLPIWRKTSVLARHYQQRYNRILGTTMYFLGAAAVVTGSSIAFLSPSDHFLYWFEVGEAFGIVLILWFAWFFEWQRKRIEYRMLSERLRAAIFLYIAGMKPEQIWLPAYLHSERGTHRWVINVFNSLTAHLSQEAKWPPLYFEPLKNLITRAWLDGQLSYYRNQEARQHRMFKRLGIIGLSTFILTMTVAILHALGVGEENLYATAALNILGLSLPAIGGAIGGVLAHREYRRNAHRYGQIALVLTPLVSKVREASDFTSLQETLLAAHHLMLREQQTWLLTVGVEPPAPA